MKYNVKGQIDLIIQEDCEDDSNISLLDYKTNININDPTNYVKQLHLYLLGIEHNPEFNEKGIKNLIIYSLASPDPINKKEPNILIKHELEEQLANAAKLIRNNDYSKTEDKNKCRNCLLKDLCNIEN